MGKAAAEAGNSASVGEGLGVLGEGSGTRKAREPKEGYRVSPLSEAHICKRPSIIFFLPFWDFFFLRHILHIYPEIHCVAQVGLKFKVLDYRHAQTPRALRFLYGKVEATGQMPGITKWSIRMEEVEKGSITSPSSAWAKGRGRWSRWGDGKQWAPPSG